MGYTPIDYENALWGKDLYKRESLIIRAEILEDIFPDIKEQTYKLLEIIDNFEIIPLENLIMYNQREFSRWLNKVFYILSETTKLVQLYVSHEKDDCPIIKLGDRDIIRTALLGCYKNRTDIEMYTTIDNIIYIIIDLCLHFNPQESELGILSFYLRQNIKYYKKKPYDKIIEEYKEIVPKYIIEYEDNEDILFKLLSDAKMQKE